jgi:hypothetical protein
MSSKEKHAKKAEPMIRFGGDWIPAHDLWNKMETANVVADTIERFNVEFPNLASAETRDVVPAVRKRLKEIDLRMPGDYSAPDLTPIALGLLESMPPEDVIKVLREKYGTEVDMAQLVQLAGEEAYGTALRREARNFALNMISPEQTAELWNDSTRPAPGGGLWSAKTVQDLLDRAD